MMRNLTLTELKNTPINSWIWIEDLLRPEESLYVQLNQELEENFLFYNYMYNKDYYAEDYGKKWFAYKNKECICPHDHYCIFPECENQNYCSSIMATLHKEQTTELLRIIKATHAVSDKRLKELIYECNLPEEIVEIPEGMERYYADSET